MANDPAVPDVKTPGGSFVPLHAVAFKEADGDAAAVTLAIRSNAVA